MANSNTDLEQRYTETLEYLYNLRVFGAKLDLTNIADLCEKFGHPEHNLRFIHVAGTNGKGSVCAMLESIYQHAGYRTGLYTSPHLIYFGERIQVNRVPISKESIVRLMDKIRPVLDQFTDKNHPTFFEVTTLLALLYFQEQQCEIVLWETGLGGRLDATNIVTPIASLITNITLEHQQYLGNTLANIASEKAGIIKNNIPVLTTETKPEPLQVIRETALQHHAPFFEIDPDTSSSIVLDVLPNSFPDYQMANCALVLKTVKTLRKQLPLSSQAIIKGIQTTQWNGRFQIIPSGHQTLVLDGAHNIGGFTALTHSFRKHFAEKPTCIIGVLADKDWNNICHIIAPMAANFYTVPVSNPRTLDPELLATKLRQYCFPGTSVTTMKSWKAALSACADSPLVLICGSLYLIGDVLQTLQHPDSNPLEKKLNEWKMVTPKT